MHPKIDIFGGGGCASLNVLAIPVYTDLKCMVIENKAENTFYLELVIVNKKVDGLVWGEAPENFVEIS